MKARFGLALLLAATFAPAWAGEDGPAATAGSKHDESAPAPADGAAAPMVLEDADGDAEHPSYPQTVLRAMVQELRYPTVALRHGWTGTAKVKVVSKRDGTMLQTMLAQSSDVPVLDEEALDVFKRMGQLPPVPDSLAPGVTTFQFVVPIKFSIGSDERE